MSIKPKIYELVSRSRHPHPWRVVDGVKLSYSRKVIAQAARKMQLENPGRQYALATIGDDGECCRIDQCDRVCQFCGMIESEKRQNECYECGKCPPRGAVAWKHEDPIEGARWIFDETEASEIDRIDPSLLIWV